MADLSKNECIVYLVRHGETHWNILGKIQGHQDTLLTKQGIQQAMNIADELMNVPFECIISSDLTRARRTAKIINKIIKRTIILEPRLRERRFGSYEGKLIKDHLPHLTPLLNKQTDPHLIKHHVETNYSVFLRAKNFLKQIAKQYLGKNILVITHRGVIKQCIRYILDIPENNIKNIKNTAYVKMSISHNQCTILTLKGITINSSQ